MPPSPTASSKRLVHADESGSPDLHRVDSHFPVFAVAFCISDSADYAKQIAPAITELKIKHFGHDAVVLHEYDIRRGKTPFAFAADDTRREFMEDLADCIAAAPVWFAASLIDKRMVPPQLAPWLDGYGICFEHGMGQIAEVLSNERPLSNRDDGIPIVAESRGKREDRRLRDAFKALDEAGNTLYGSVKFDLVIAEKTLNLPGMQLADLAAHPIARHYLEPDQPNRAWDVIRDKLILGPAGDTRLVDVSRLTQRHPPKRVS